MMTSTSTDTDEQDRSAQMAKALIAHLGTTGAALRFADRQRLTAEEGALTTWTAIAGYLEQLHQQP